MTYHLPRIAHWIQNGSLHPYATSITRQISQPALAEYLGALVFLATERWEFLPLIQVAALLACALLATHIASQLGHFDRTTGFLAAAGVLSLPPAILQATSAKNDIVLALSGLVVVLGTSLVLREEVSRGMLCVIVGVGLGISTKGTALVIFPPIATLALGSWLGQRGWRRATRAHLLALALCTAIAAPTYCWNQQVFGSPWGPGPSSPGWGVSFANEGVRWQNWISGWIRNGALHIGLPSAEGTRAFEAACVRLLASLSIDPNDPATTWPGTRFDESVRPYPSLHPDLSAAPLHALWLATVFVGILFCRRRSHRVPALLLVAVVAGAALFGGILKWQPWHARLHIPLFVMAVPPAAHLTRSALGRIPSAALGFALLLSAIPFLLRNELRPLLPWPGVLGWEVETSLPGGSRSSNVYREIVRQAAERQWSTVGLVFGEDELEFPLWWATQERDLDLRWRHVFVQNDTKRFEIRRGIDAILISRRSSAQSADLRTELLRMGATPVPIPDSGFDLLDVRRIQLPDVQLFDDGFESGRLELWKVVG